MALLDTTTCSLEISLGASVATQLKAVGSYDVYAVVAGARVKKRGVRFRVTTNNTTPVPLVPAPAAGFEHELHNFYLVQVNAGTVRVIIDDVDSGGRAPIFDAELDERDNVQGG